MLFAYSSLILAVISAALGHPSDSQGDGDRKRALLRAERWLMEQRNGDFHWGPSTAPVLLALSRVPSWDANSVESRLGIRKLDVDFLYAQVKKENSIGRRILLIQTLASLCRNINDYYGYNLPAELLRTETSDFAFALELLTVCGTSAHIHKKHGDRLIDLLDPKKWQTQDHKGDTMAIVAMATECLRYRYKNTDFLLPKVKELVDEMNQKQLDNGSFGDNVITTALSIQAMQTDSDGLGVNRNLDSAVDWLLSVQKEDGSFGDVMATTEAVIALSPVKGRINLDAKCVKRFETPRAVVDETFDVRSGPRTKLVHVHFWFEAEDTSSVGGPFLKRDIDVALANDASVYDVLQKIHQTSKEFKFQFEQFAFGQYLTSVNDYQDGSPNHWIAYVLPSSDARMLLDGNSAELRRHQLKTDMESSRPRDGDIVLLWYQPIH